MRSAECGVRSAEFRKEFARGRICQVVPHHYRSRTNIEHRTSNIEHRMRNGEFGIGEMHHRAMLEVMANMTERTLISKKPTKIAIIMIMAGSIMLVTTRRAMLSSFS